jgi:hypothetical protein
MQTVFLQAENVVMFFWFELRAINYGADVRLPINDRTLALENFPGSFG